MFISVWYLHCRVLYTHWLRKACDSSSCPQSQTYASKKFPGKLLDSKINTQACGCVTKMTQKITSCLSELPPPNRCCLQGSAVTALWVVMALKSQSYMEPQIYFLLPNPPPSPLLVLKCRKPTHCVRSFPVPLVTPQALGCCFSLLSLFSTCPVDSEIMRYGHE